MRLQMPLETWGRRRLRRSAEVAAGVAQSAAGLAQNSAGAAGSTAVVATQAADQARTESPGRVGDRQPLPAVSEVCLILA